MNHLKHASMLGILLACALAPISAPSTPANLTQSAPSAEPPAIVVGFLGGFVSPENHVHSEVQLAERLRRSYPSGVDVEVFENRRVEQAHRRILALLTAGSHGALSNSERQDARIVLYGHSWGGAAVVQLARALQKDGIPVLLTVQVDAISKDWRNVSIIPSNVLEAANFYQTQGLIHGVREIRPQNSSRTQIVGNFRFDYTHSDLRCPGYPWWDDYFMKAHIQIECDPAVWNTVDSLITAALPLPARQNVANAHDRLAAPEATPSRQ